MSVLKIGEFSQLGRVSVRMLRHYDATGLLKPAEVDHLSGYRFYDVEQLPRLNRILALKDLGLSLEQVGSLLAVEEPPASELRVMLAVRRADLEQELHEGRERLARVEARLRQIEREGESFALRDSPQGSSAPDGRVDAHRRPDHTRHARLPL